jgi:beta-glucosidase/6-phospho-beta-glucosidase/beta-galactosidase
MKRREWIRNTTIAGTGLLFSRYLSASGPFMYRPEGDLLKSDFGNGFKWGVASSSYQTEGAWNLDGKSESNWDYFSRIHGKIERGENADIAADFYHRYSEDIDLIKAMNFNAFRFSLSWPRILPEGTGTVNQKGIDFYHKVIDKCLSAGIEPWITLYHWDMPQVLEARGGWANRKIIDWFSEYIEVATKEYGTCVPDKLENGRVHDKERIDYFKNHLGAVLKAKRDGINANGYFVWSPTDNFEWDKGYRTRFGLVYVDFKTLESYIKDSGFWFQKFLKD